MSNHPIVHIEIPAKKAEEAGKFYGDLFGWKIEADPMYNYVQFQAEGGPGGGFARLRRERRHRRRPCQSRIARWQDRVSQNRNPPRRLVRHLH